MSRVDLELDLRGYKHLRPANPDQLVHWYLAVWTRIEGVLRAARAELTCGRRHELGGEDGDVGLTIVHASSPVVRVDENTVFSIYGVLEPPRLHYRCSTCGNYAPYLCWCSSPEHPCRACDDHVIVLDGSLRSSCQRHVPRCECGELATFWCARRRGCNRDKAWCANHRVPHPSIPDLDFCPTCFAAEFPRCSTPACEHGGTQACEHVDFTTWQACGAQSCPQHASYWLVFGRKRIREAIVRCHRHANAHLETPESLALAIAAACSDRRLTGLPSMRDLGDMIRPHHPGAWQSREVVHVLERLPNHLTKKTEIERGAIHLVDRSLAQVRRDEARGRQFFEQIVAVCGSRSPTIAASLVYLGFQVRDSRVFVDLAPEFRRQFIGRGGGAITELSRTIGCTINVTERSARCGCAWCVPFAREVNA